MEGKFTRLQYELIELYKTNSIQLSYQIGVIFVPRRNEKERTGFQPFLNKINISLIITLNLIVD
jgi:hypothetical protein